MATQTAETGPLPELTVQWGVTLTLTTVTAGSDQGWDRRSTGLWAPGGDRDSSEPPVSRLPLWLEPIILILKKLKQLTVHCGFPMYQILWLVCYLHSLVEFLQQEDICPFYR